MCYQEYVDFTASRPALALALVKIHVAYGMEHPTGCLNSVLTAVYMFM